MQRERVESSRVESSVAGRSLRHARCSCESGAVLLLAVWCVYSCMKLSCSLEHLLLVLAMARPIY
jgi:hypothetical protein